MADPGRSLLVRLRRGGGLCCHPDLPCAGQIARTLSTVGGLTTAEIARAFLVPETTMAHGEPHAHVPEHTQRLGAVLHVLYLIFRQGCERTDLAAEAIRPTRAVWSLLPDDGGWPPCWR